jgi:protein SCO1/2
LSPGCLSSETEDKDIFYGQDLPADNPDYSVPEFSLMNIDANLINLSDYEGQVVIVSFVYTRCPDVCPIVSSNLRWIAQNLSDDYGTNFSIISITVDPWWDTHYTLNDYATLRNLNWPHLTGEVEDIEPVWEAFHVGLQTYANSSYEEDNGTQGSSETSGRHHPDYLVDHSTATIIIDKNHQQRVRWDDLDWEVELFAEDVKYLINE